MENANFIHHFDMSPLDQYAPDDDFHQQIISRETTAASVFPDTTTFCSSFIDVPALAAVRPSKVLKTSRSADELHAPAALGVAEDSSQRLLSLGKQNDQIGFYSNVTKGSCPNYGATSCMGWKRTTGSLSRPPSHAQDHIMAERKRREKLSQRLIALSAIVPGLKKTDKASVLEDAIKYVKQLQERVKTLEDQTHSKAIESVVLVKKSQLLPIDDAISPPSSDVSFEGQTNTGEALLPEIEVKVSDKTVLMKIHCRRRRGMLVKVLREIDELHLAVANTNVIPFAGSTFDITIVAHMEEEYSMTVKDLVKKLNSTISDFL